MRVGHWSLGSLGFTIVQMLMIFAIVGILVVLGASSYLQRKNRTIQAEAKIALASIHTAEQAFLTAKGSYTACLSAIGYRGVDSPEIYYSTGFSNMAAVGAKCGQRGKSSCTQYDWDVAGVAQSSCAASAGETYFLSNRAVSPYQGAAGERGTDEIDLERYGGSELSKNKFVAVAIGDVVPSPPNEGELDIWNVDEAKNISNRVSGL